jgi:hypothetical protein
MLATKPLFRIGQRSQSMLRAARARVFVACLFSFALAAGGAPALAQDPPPCVVEDPSPGVGGRFEAVISGADPIATELAGFATSSGSDGLAWTVHLLTPGGENSILLATEGTGRPAPGRYRIGDYAASEGDPPLGEYVAIVALAGDALAATGFRSVKGTLTIASSSAAAVAGCFDFSAADMQTGPRVTVGGTFAAGNKDY